VRVKCFACESVIEAESVDGIVDAFVAHGQESHMWPYPEKAVRNYARNYAEATERLSGAVERLSEIGQVTVHPVTEERVEDWLRFFDSDGFADNPDWASCYCLEPHVPANAEEPERAWRDVREAMVRRIRRGATYGYLAYVKGQAVGWVNASSRAEYGLYLGVDAVGPEPASVVGISCFVIAPPFRRHGVASALLDRVIADARVRGATWIEAYPHNSPEKGDAGQFRGPRSMYIARGFEPVAVKEKFTVMRRRAT